MKKLVMLVFSLFIIFSFFGVAQSAVNTSVSTPLTKQIGQGSTGVSVVALQSFLVKNGYLTGLVDGKFGSKTKAGVIKYQKASKISPTGFVGPLTFASINKIIMSQAVLDASTNTNIVTQPEVTLMCEYARPPAGFHYENLKQHPPCGADLVHD